MLSKSCNFYVHRFVKRCYSQQHHVIRDVNLKSAAAIPPESYEFFFLIYSNHSFYFFPSQAEKFRLFSCKRYTNGGLTIHVIFASCLLNSIDVKCDLRVHFD